MTVTRTMDAEMIPREAATLARSERGPCQAAMLTWLEGKAVHTRRSYMTALGAFLRATETHPADIESLDVARWKEHLKQLTGEEHRHRAAMVNALGVRV